MHKKNFKLIIAALLVIIVFLSAFCIKYYFDLKEAENQAESIRQNYTDKNKELDKKIRDIDTKLFELEDKYYEDKLTKLLNKDQLILLEKGQWKYSLTANDTPFKEDHIYLSTREVTLVFTESQFEDKLLPTGLHNKGSLVNGDQLDKFYDHLIIETQVPYEKKIQTNKNYTNVYYVFKNVTRGTIITLRLSEPLKERLKLDYDTLEVIVNKTE